MTKEGTGTVQLRSKVAISRAVGLGRSVLLMNIVKIQYRLTGKFKIWFHKTSEGFRSENDRPLNSLQSTRGEGQIKPCGLSTER